MAKPIAVLVSTAIFVLEVARANSMLQVTPALLPVSTKIHDRSSDHKTLLGLLEMEPERVKRYVATGGAGVDNGEQWRQDKK